MKVAIGVNGRQVGQPLNEKLGQGADLLLLELERDELVVLTGLQVKRALAHRSNRADGQPLDGR